MSDNTPQNAPDVPPAPPAPPAAVPASGFSAPDASQSPSSYPAPDPSYPETSYSDTSYSDTSYATPNGQPAYPAYPTAPPAYTDPSGYPQAPAPYAYGAPAYPYAAGPKTNGLAITSLISSIAAFVILPFIASIVAVITGHMALRQLRTSGENGRGMALAGTIVGYVGVALGAVFIIFLVVTFVSVFSAVGYGAYTYSS